MQVPFQPPPSLVRGGDDPGPGRDELDRVCAFDIAVVIQVDELRDASLGSGRPGTPDARLSASAAPHEPFIDDDRCSDPRCDPFSHFAVLAGELSAAVDTGRATGAEHLYADVLECPVRADRPETRVAPSRHDSPGGVRFVAEVARYLGVQDPSDLFGNGGEDLVRLGAPGHERCHPSQRSLFLRQPRDLGPCLRVGDRGGDKVGEGCKAVHRVRGQRQAIFCGAQGHAPQARPLTKTGTPTAAPMPSSLAVSVPAPAACAWSSILSPARPLQRCDNARSWAGKAQRLTS